MVKILLADCMDYMRELPDNAFHLAVVDPPYGAGTAKLSATRYRDTDKWQRAKVPGYGDYDDVAPGADYFTELFRVSHNQIIWGGNYFTPHLPVSKGWIVWNKLATPGQHLGQAELAYTSFGQRILVFDYLWVGFQQKKPEQRIHPSHKPIDLYRWLYQNYSRPGFRILDTHLGSGSSAIAASDAGLDFVGCEINPDYHAAALQRFDDQTRQALLL